MKEYSIPVSYLMQGEYKVKTASLKEAVKFIEEGEDNLQNSTFNSLPEGSEYVDSTMLVNEQTLKALYSNESY